MGTFDNNAIYYKYRSLKYDDFERFIDIVLNDRLYGSVYNEMNDPMEGRFCRKDLGRKTLESVYEELRCTRVCSFKQKLQEQMYPNTQDDYMMWSHYADGHNGCCVEFTLSPRNNRFWDLMPVEYGEELPKIEDDEEARSAVDKILSVKSSSWSYENEVRAIRHYDKDKLSKSNKYFKIDIKAIYLGKKMKKERCDILKQIIHSKDKNIKIFKMVDTDRYSSNYPILDVEEI